MASIADMVLRQFSADEAARRGRIARAWSAYYGEMPRPLRVKPGDPDDNVRLNLPRLIVDKGVSFLFGKPAEMTVMPAPGLRGTDLDGVQSWLDAVWADNRKATLLHKLAINGGVCGHALAKIVGGERPRIVVLDPQNVSAQWDIDDYEHVRRWVIEWHGIDPDTGQAVAHRQTMDPRDSGWSIVDEESRGDSSAWSVTAREAWPHPWPPVVGCQNLPAPNEFWGVSDLEEDLLGLAGSINFVLSNVTRVIRHYAHPRTWGVGFQPHKLKWEPGDLLVLPSIDAKLENLEMKGDLRSSLDLYARLKEAFHEMARVPESAMGRLDRGSVASGLALRVLYEPLSEKTRTKRMLYGEMLGELSRRLLAFCPAVGSRDDIHIEVRWPDPGPAGGDCTPGTGNDESERKETQP